MSTAEYPALASGDGYVFTVGNRTVHIWVHDCDSCTSVDLWTTRGRDVEEISARTGDTTRAPTGFMGWINGSRPEVGVPPMEGSHKWPAFGTISAIWHDEPRGAG